MFFLIIYWIVGYIAVTKTIDEGKVFFYSGSALFLRRAALGLFFGWIFIPWMIIKMITKR